MRARDRSARAEWRSPGAVGQSSLLLHLDPARGWTMITRDTIAETVVVAQTGIMNRLAVAIA
jgi:hypothetical protein